MNNELREMYSELDKLQTQRRINLRKYIEPLDDAIKKMETDIVIMEGITPAMIKGHAIIQEWVSDAGYSYTVDGVYYGFDDSLNKVLESAFNYYDSDEIESWSYGYKHKLLPEVA